MMLSAATPAAFSANTPAFAIGIATQSPTPYTSGNGVSSVSWSTATQPFSARPDSTSTAGTRWIGIPMKRS